MQYLPIRQKYDPSTLQNPLTSGESVAKYSNAIQKFLETKDQLSQSQGGQEGGVSPLAKWQLRNQAMMQSGNPILQQQALKEQETYATQMMQAQFREKKMSPSMLLGKEMGLQEGTTPMQEWLRTHAMKSGTTIDMGQKYMSIDDLKKIETRRPDGSWGPATGGMTQDDFITGSQAGQYRLKNEMAAGDAGKYSMLTGAQDMMRQTEAMLFNEDGSVNREILNGVTTIDKLESIPWVGSFAAGIAREHFDPKASMVQNTLEIGMQAITRTETGAAMTSQEIGNTKQRFMPKTGDPDPLIKAKIRAFNNFIGDSIDLIRSRTTGGRKGEMTKAEIEAGVEKALSEIEVGADQDDDMSDILPEGYKWVD